MDLSITKAISDQTPHAQFTNKELAVIGVDAERLKTEPRIAGFLDRIAHKPADFHTATHRSNEKPSG